MSEQSKDVRDPSFSAESSQVEVDSTPEVPWTLPPPASEAQTISEPQNLPLRPQDAQQDTAQAFSLEPQAISDKGAPKDLQEAEEEARRQALSGPWLPPSHSPPGPAQLVQKAHELMWYVLVKEQRKAGIWFPDMVKDVIGSYKKWCRSILRRTSLILARVFGLQLRLTSLHTMEFSLVRALEPEELDRVALGSHMPMAGLLLMILSLVYVKGRGAKESAVWNVLRILGLRPWKMHPTFGEVRKLIVEEFVQQNYLKYQRVLHVEPPEYEFSWGSRASLEITKMQIMEFLARVFKKDPQAWPSRYREALEQARALQEAEMAVHHPRSSVSEDD
ncbi:PREDICTED: necdin-like [Elephantulus edwardii]|uniref:necdin-like n=1 Tax=Elephantulus edwardii TaxID=28737 RepID=UPI0003F0DD83|nr:PREDICTED: necdin-like [Elephantulus edwardii]